MAESYPRIAQVVLDTTDARTLAEFYRQLFGLEYRAGDEPPAPSRPDPRGSDWLVLRNPHGGPQLAIQQTDGVRPSTWPDAAVPQMLHLDTVVATIDVNFGDLEVTARYDRDQASCTSAGWSALVQSGLLSGDERGEVVEGGGPAGLGVVTAGGVGPVAERHPRLGAVVVELYARDRGIVHAHLGHRVRA
jgi:Glyoxalase-like domain